MSSILIPSILKNNDKKYYSDLEISAIMKILELIGRTHCWCSINPFWSRKFNRDLSLQFCPYGQCDLQISGLRSTLFGEWFGSTSGYRIVTYKEYRTGVLFVYQPIWVVLETVISYQVPIFHCLSYQLRCTWIGSCYVFV